MILFTYTKHRDGENILVEFDDVEWATCDGIVEDFNGKALGYVDPDAMALDLVKTVMEPHCVNAEFFINHFNETGGSIGIRKRLDSGEMPDKF